MVILLQETQAETFWFGGKVRQVEVNSEILIEKTVNFYMNIVSF